MKRESAPEKSERLWRESCENQRKLIGCPRHLFDFAAYTHTMAVSRVPCLRCGGAQSVTLALSYIEGFLVCGGDLSQVAANVTVAISTLDSVCPCCDGKDREPYPGAWPGDKCPLCAGKGSVNRKIAADYLHNRN